MTYQIQEEFRYEGNTYSLAASSSDEPFRPQRLDLDSVTLWKYRDVLELRFQRGLLSTVRDLSSAMLPIQKLADRKNEHTRAFFADVSEAIRAVKDDRERRAIKKAYFDADSEAEFDADMNDVASEKLRGVLDEAYFGS